MTTNGTKRSAGPDPGAGDRRERISGRTLGLMISVAILFAALTLLSQSFLSGYTMFVVSRQMASTSSSPCPRRSAWSSAR